VGHVLGAAQSDAFGAELAAELVGPFHEALEDARRGVGVNGVGLAGEDLVTGTAFASLPHCVKRIPVVL
jgi:hypothetical protein